jgi:hypothetical protein
VLGGIRHNLEREPFADLEIHVWLARESKRRKVGK